LKKYISCGESSLPEIDFNKNSLLLVSGGSERGISAIPKKLQQLSANLYQWDIEILLDETGELEEWVIAITTSKPIVESTVKLNTTTSKEYSIDVPFSTYFVKYGGRYNDSNCKYYNHEGKVIVINNQEELDKYLPCRNNIPEVDFSKHSLLLTSASTDISFFLINNNTLQKLSSNDYVWNIDLFLSSGDSGSNWTNVILTKKIGSNSNVKSNIIEKEKPSDNDSIEIFIRDYNLSETLCIWENLEDNKIKIVRNNTELEKYLTCSNGSYPNIYLGYGTELWLTKVSVPKPINTISKRLFLFNEKYVLNVEITLSNMGQPKEHIIALFKECAWFSCPIELNVNIID
jgi:hypothetical protein